MADETPPMANGGIVRRPVRSWLKGECAGRECELVVPLASSRTDIKIEVNGDTALAIEAIRQALARGDV